MFVIFCDSSFNFSLFFHFFNPPSHSSSSSSSSPPPQRGMLLAFCTLACIVLGLLWRWAHRSHAATLSAVLADPQSTVTLCYGEAHHDVFQRISLAYQEKGWQVHHVHNTASLSTLSAAVICVESSLLDNHITQCSPTSSIVLIETGSTGDPSTPTLQSKINATAVINVRAVSNIANIPLIVHIMSGSTPLPLVALSGLLKWVLQGVVVLFGGEGFSGEWLDVWGVRCGALCAVDLRHFVVMGVIEGLREAVWVWLLGQKKEKGEEEKKEDIVTPPPYRTGLASPLAPSLPGTELYSTGHITPPQSYATPHDSPSPIISSPKRSHTTATQGLGNGPAPLPSMGGGGGGGGGSDGIPSILPFNRARSRTPEVPEVVFIEPSLPAFLAEGGSERSVSGAKNAHRARQPEETKVNEVNIEKRVQTRRCVFASTRCPAIMEELKEALVANGWRDVSKLAKAKNEAEAARSRGGQLPSIDVCLEDRSAAEMIVRNWSKSDIFIKHTTKSTEANTIPSYDPSRPSRAVLVNAHSNIRHLTSKIMFHTKTLPTMDTTIRTSFIHVSGPIWEQPHLAATLKMMQEFADRVNLGVTTQTNFMVSTPLTIFAPPVTGLPQRDVSALNTTNGLVETTTPPISLENHRAVSALMDAAHQAAPTSLYRVWGLPGSRSSLRPLSEIAELYRQRPERALLIQQEWDVPYVPFKATVLITHRYEARVSYYVGADDSVQAAPASLVTVAVKDCVERFVASMLNAVRQSIPHTKTAHPVSMYCFGVMTLELAVLDVSRSGGSRLPMLALTDITPHTVQNTPNLVADIINNVISDVFSAESEGKSVTKQQRRMK